MAHETGPKYSDGVLIKPKKKEVTIASMTKKEYAKWRANSAEVKAMEKKPSPKPSPKPGIKVALGGGVTMDAKTGKKTKKPSPLPSTKSNKQYFADQKKFVKSNTTNK